jgi:hypothetical protein
MKMSTDKFEATRRNLIKLAAIGGLTSPAALAQTACPAPTPSTTVKFFFNVAEPPFNAAHDGITDDTAAIQLAITTAQAAGGGVVILPAGQYLVAGTLVIDGTLYFGAGVEIQGVGPHRTSIIVPTTTTADTIVFNNTDSGAVRSLSIKSCLSRAGGSSVRLIDTTNMVIDNFVTQFQYIAVRVNGGSLQRIRSGYWHLGKNGTGLLVDGGGSAGNPSNDTHIDRVYTIGGRYGFRIRRSGAICMHGCQGTECETGLMIDPPPGQGVTFSFFSDCAWDTTSSHCMHLIAYPDTPTPPTPPNPANDSFIHSLTFTNCWSATTTVGNCCVIEGGGVNGVELIGHRFINAPQGSGLFVTQSAKNVRVDACTAAGCPNGSGYAFLNGANSFAVRNSHAGTYGSYDSGTLSGNLWGVTVGSGATDYLITSNTLKGNIWGALQDLATGPKIVANNLV